MHVHELCSRSTSTSRPNVFWTLVKSVKFLDISKDAQSFLPSASVFILLSCSWYSFFCFQFFGKQILRCLSTDVLKLPPRSRPSLRPNKICYAANSPNRKCACAKLKGDNSKFHQFRCQTTKHRAPRIGFVLLLT